MSLDDLVKVATLGGCLDHNNSSMESLISDLKYQYAASASVAVSQAMLLQVLNKSRQIESKMISSSRAGVEQTTTTVANNGSGKLGRGASRLLDRVGAQIALNDNRHRQPASDQHAPLDLSVRSPPAAQQDLHEHRPTQHNNHNHQSSRSRSQSKQLKRHQNQQQQKQQQQQPLDIFKTTARQTSNSRPSIDVATAHLLHQAKLITSSTSPNSSVSTASPSGPSISAAPSPSGRLLQDTNNNNNNNNNDQDELEPAAYNHHTAAFAQHNDVISSTNNRQRQRRQQAGSIKAGAKKQKGAKSHLCNFCGRSFSRSDMLTRHSRLHSGLKPYQCGKCYQVFSRSDHLSTHERTHTGEKPYQCNHCDYSACRRDMITRHMRTHTAAGGQDGAGELAATRLKSRHRRARKSAAESENSSDKLMLAIEGEQQQKQQRDDEDHEVSTNFEMEITD